MPAMQGLLQNINIIFLIAIILYIWRISKGSTTGFVGEIGALADIAIVSFMVVVAITFIDSIIDKNLISLLASGVVFLVVLIARKVIRAVFCSLKVIAKLPLISSLNQFLGLLAGAIEATIIIWVFYSILPAINDLFPGNAIMNQITSNTFLNYLYFHNDLGNLVQTLTHFLTQKTSEIKK
jgi:uncharacterized membrane protein required for colicin V production